MTRALRITLIASLVLNLVFLCAGAALLGAMAMARHQHGPIPGLGPAAVPGPRIIVGALPKESRQRILLLLQDDRQAARETARTAREARRLVVDAFLAEPFSGDVLKDRLGQSRTADMAAVTAAHDVIVTLMEALSPEERALVAEAVRTRLMSRPHRQGFGLRGEGREAPEPFSEPLVVPLPGPPGPADEAGLPGAPPLP